MALQAVGFDIDGTLYPDWRARSRSLFFLLRHVRPVVAFARVRRIMRELDENPETAEHPVAEVELFAQELKCTVSEARTIRDTVIYAGWEKCFKNVRPYSHVRESLEALSAAGLKLAALSDFPVGNKLKYFGLDGIFDVEIGFPESQRLKPRQEPFLEMARCLDVEPQNILYIGNKLTYDVRGAEGAGMRGALIGPPGRSAPPDVLTFEDYPQMVETLLSEVTS
ncbi:MAG: HAD family hydrolase [Spirochaetales bacterium]|nr:HAD family hydrolase [Spirochaetales bacterium]